LSFGSSWQLVMDSLCIGDCTAAHPSSHESAWLHAGLAKMVAGPPRQSSSYTTLRNLSVGWRTSLSHRVGESDHAMFFFSGRGLAPQAMMNSGVVVHALL